jgi:hypothetical protein
MDYLVALVAVAGLALLATATVYCVRRLMKLNPNNLLVRSPIFAYGFATLVWIALISWPLLNSYLGSQGASRYVKGSAPSHPQMPSFSWPPPSASSVYRIPLERLLQGPTGEAELGDIAMSLYSALAKAGQNEKSFYSIPEGFALVTRMEAISKDGMSKPEISRWDTGSRPPHVFSIASYLEALFKSPPGHYRVIVFLVTSVPFSATDSNVSRDDVARWLRQGAVDLDRTTFAIPVTSSTRCSALIYEFEKTTPTAVPVLLRPGAISAAGHVMGAGLRSLLQ